MPGCMECLVFSSNFTSYLIREESIDIISWIYNKQHGLPVLMFKNWFHTEIPIHWHASV